MIIISLITFFFSLASVIALRIAVGSCHSQKEDHDGMWHMIAESQPAYLVLLGDNIYADQKMRLGRFKPATPATITAQYDSLASNAAWQELVSVVGGYEHILATWDDHDYGVDNADCTYPHRNESLEAFLNFFHYNDAEKEYFLSRGGVYFSKTINYNKLKIKFIMLDTRYFKDPASIPNRDILGEAQWIWLEDELLDASSPDIIFLGSSIQVLPTQKIVEETWSDFPSARSRLLRLIDTAPCPNIFILSGDVHTAEINQAHCSRRDLVEFTSSGLSHTFVSKIVPTTQNSSIVPSIESRGWLNVYLFTLYQAMYPARHREHKYADMYRGIHFGLIDVSDTSLVFRIINHEGNTVITKTVPLLPISVVAQDAHEHKCEPFWGAESIASYYLFKFVMVLGIAMVFVVPMAIFGSLTKLHRHIRKRRARKRRKSD